MRKTIIVIAIVVTAAIIIAAVTDKKQNISWKTEPCKSGYVTHFYSNGKYNCSVTTQKKIPVCIYRNPEDVCSRTDKYILVEKITGSCINEKGDGKDEDGNYISYHNMNFKVEKGGKYTTYLIYENDNSIDNIIGRIDYRS